jgi:hypothetical protein
VDENYPISVKQWIRGWGGCALLWRKELDQYIDCITDGGNRLVSIILNQEEKPLCIRPKKKICVFTVTRPTLIFASDPMHFYTEFG